MQRQTYDLSNVSLVLGNIGRVMTSNVIPVVAGDSISVASGHVIQLSPFRRPLSIDPVVDICSFFVPHRHIYGDDWINFIKAGINETITFTGRTTNRTIRFIPWCWDMHVTAKPKWLTDGYFKIWNRYFRPANMGITEETQFPATVDGWEASYGKKAAHLPSPWTEGVRSVPSASHRTYNAPVTGANALIDTVTIDRTRADYAGQLGEDWFGRYYNDLLKSRYGGRASTDADERPTFIMHTTQALSGLNIYATDTSSLGASAGKSGGVLEHEIPRFFVPEHGAIWTLIVLRFPPIHRAEVHYLSKKVNPSYKEISGDPVTIAGEPPVQYRVDDYFAGTNATTMLYQPYGNWYRTQPNVVHPRFIELNGYPMLDTVPTSHLDAALVRSEDYNLIFQSTAAGHWQAQSTFKVEVDRVVPDAYDSIFVGA